MLQVQVVRGQSCAGVKSYGKNFEYVTPVRANEIKVMSYNVENLFDAQHAIGRDDYEFLPIQHPEKSKCAFKQGYYKQVCKTLDWTDEKVYLKLNQIRNVIALQGELPDILAVQEVENEAVVNMLAGSLGYEYYIHTTGNDKRIELGLLFNEARMSFKEAQELIVEFPEGVRVKHTRNILVAHFVPKQNPNAILAVYVNHWPSQDSPAGARVQAALTMKSAIDYYTELYGVNNYHVIATGDFNTVDRDVPHAFHNVLFDQSWKNMLFDLDHVYYSHGYREDPKDMYLKMPPGTYYYGRERIWNKFDRFFISRNLLDRKGVDAMTGTYRILAGEFMLATYEDKKSNYCYDGVPYRYNHFATNQVEAGYSDHFPILFKLKIRRN
jgi:hypothetical protein